MRDALRRYWWVVGLALAAGVVVLLAPVASPDPDGLERVATDDGFLERGQDPAFNLLPDYAVPGIEGDSSTIVAGLIGVAVVAALMLLVGRALARRRS